MYTIPAPSISYTVYTQPTMPKFHNRLGCAGHYGALQKGARSRSTLLFAGAMEWSGSFCREEELEREQLLFSEMSGIFCSCSRSFLLNCKYKYMLVLHNINSTHLCIMYIPTLF